MKKTKTIHTIYFPLAFILTIIVPLVVFGYFVFHNNLLTAIIFVIILVPLGATEFFISSVKNVKVDTENNHIVFKDGMGSAALIPFGAITLVKKDRSWLYIDYRNGDDIKTFKLAHGFYLPSSLKEIIDSIRKFNPSAKLP